MAPTPTIEEYVGRFTDSASTPPTEAQKDAQKQVREAVEHLALVLAALVPEGRQKSVAFTALEEVQMRANRGIFTEGEK